MLVPFATREEAEARASEVSSSPAIRQVGRGYVAIGDLERLPDGGRESRVYGDDGSVAWFGEVDWDQPMPPRLAALFDRRL